MNIHWNSDVLDLSSLLELARRNPDALKRYLQQFQDLIPGRIIALKQSLEAGDRKGVRQILHKMSPQLQFFGIPDVLQPIRRLEHEYETIPISELQDLVADVVKRLSAALAEVKTIIDTYLSQ